jgi:YD repeat-containing protein
MSTTATENVTPTSSASTENTQFTYDQATGLVTKTFTSDGLTLEFCYYPADASTGTPDRSDKVPDVTQLLSGFTLENVEATSLVDALTLKCESLPDKSTPPLMAQCEYLSFPDGTRSTTTLTLYGYANATIDNAGVLIPDTVLNLVSCLKNKYSI